MSFTEDPRFLHRTYMIRRKFFRIFGGAFHVYDAAENLVLYSEMKRFKIKEDIRLFTGEDMSREVLTIKARHMFDIATTYDVIDSTTGQPVGALKRRALKSMLRDEWAILGPGDVEIGLVQEESLIKALVRRVIGGVVTMLMPQAYDVTCQGQSVARFQQAFNPIIFKLNVDFTPDHGQRLDRRLGLAAAILMTAIEGREG